MSRQSRLVLVAVFILGLLYAGHYVHSLRKLTITYQNITQVRLYKTKSLDNGRVSKPYKVVSNSGQSITIPQGEYTAQYIGKTGYNSKYVDIALKKDTVTHLTASYSNQHLAALLREEYPQIIQAISNSYPAANYYLVDQGSLLRNGEWYITTLKYIGFDTFNADMLRLILYKEHGTWTIKAAPALVFNKYDYPNVPIDILRAANGL